VAARMTLRQEILAAFGCGAVVGGVVVAAVLDRQLRLKYNKIADEEIESVKKHYREAEMNLLEAQKRLAEQPKPDLDEIVKELGYKVETKYSPAEVKAISDAVDDEEMAERAEELQEREEAEEEERNAFADLPGWNYDQQVASRIADKPFIMHMEEFQQSECSHQVTITYFEGDDVLVDESDEVISKKDEVVGMEHLSKFGFGSGDPNVVYVRNPKLDIEYEILRHRGHYASEILGIEEEHLEHSAMPRRRRTFDDGTT
jgi:hypothetical protein